MWPEVAAVVVLGILAWLCHHIRSAREIKILDVAKLKYIEIFYKVQRNIGEPFKKKGLTITSK